MSNNSNHPFQLRTAAFLANPKPKEMKEKSASHSSRHRPATFQFSTRLRNLSSTTARPTSLSSSSSSSSSNEIKADTKTAPLINTAVCSTSDKPKHENWKFLGISREEYYAMGQDEHYDNYDFNNYVETETDSLIFETFYEHSRKCFAAYGRRIPEEEDNPFNFD